MFDTSLHSTGREHTITIALLAAAFIFIPALVAVWQPSNYLPAIGASALCVTLAWFDWRRSQKIPTSPIAMKGKATK